MRNGVEFLIGLLDGPDPACASAEDFDGPHGAALQSWQDRGLLAREPSANPAPSCPYCTDGVPYPLGDRYLCHRCRSPVDPRCLMLWAFDREAFFHWLAREVKCHGGGRPVDPALWQLGTWQGGDEPFECFYRRRGDLSEYGRARLHAHRNVLLLHGLAPPPEPEAPRARRLSLLDLLAPDGSLAVRDLGVLFAPRGNVRFDAHSGVLWVGDQCVGEVPPGTKEFYFLSRLAAELDHFVPYADLKRYVLRQAGSSDGTEEATFCQKLKSRVKRKYVPRVDRLLVTTSKGDGYRLRGYGDV